MQDPNKYADHISLHEKCLGILQMREKFVERLNSAEDLLTRFDKATTWDPIRLMNYRWKLEHRVMILRHTVERVTGYYESMYFKMFQLFIKVMPTHKGLLDTIVHGRGNVVGYNTSKWKEMLDSFPITCSSTPVFGRVEKALNDFNVTRQGNDFTVEPINVPYEEHYASGPSTGYQ